MQVINRANADLAAVSTPQQTVRAESAISEACLAVKVSKLVTSNPVEDRGSAGWFDGSSLSWALGER